MTDKKKTPDIYKLIRSLAKGIGDNIIELANQIASLNATVGVIQRDVKDLKRDVEDLKNRVDELTS